MTILRWVTDVVTWLIPPCREVVRWASQDLDGQLRWHQRARIQLHLLMCRLCRRYQQQLIALRAALRSDPERLADAAQQLSPEAKQQIKDALKNPTPPVAKM